ncbi:MAG: hypothetical protein IJJ20_04260 [Thermoguttaceae bacterium]|nr:hypothetical protein [Thermoguttaceae bacterium]
MNSKKRSFLWVWLLLLIFGIPSVGGRGLHLFLSGESGCPCRVCRDSSSAAPLHGSAGYSCSAAEKTVFPVQAGSVPNHDEGCCFLCRFLTQPPTVSASSLLLFAFGPVGTVDRRPCLFLSSFPVFHSGRSPPAPLF